MSIGKTASWLALAPLACLLVCAASPASAASGTVSGELRKWHRVTITFDGPSTGETANPNPFRDYRLNVTFKHSSGRTYLVPGYFAADGNAADTGATSGHKWRVHFSPDLTGTWTYTVSFRKGTDVALSASATAGSGAGYFDGANGTLNIGNSDKTGRDFRGKGRLRYVGEHYYRFAESGEYFIKVGPGSPESFLANPDIDCEDPSGARSTFSSHGQHWQNGDPTWKGGKGKNIIGAANYIAGKGMNCFYILTYTGHGDTVSVWPYRRVDDRYRFDCSKLDQWEIVFEHLGRKGILIHLVLSETENESYWEVMDGVMPFAPSRKLYYRELIARFGHHLALQWNLGEEIGFSDGKGGALGKATTDAQRKAFASFIRDTDPYDSPIVCHTLPNGPWEGSWDNIYTPLLGYTDFEGISGQFNIGTNGMATAHNLIKSWVDKSARAGRKWVVCNDEAGGEDIPLQYTSSGNRIDTAGVRPDALDPGHDYPRKWALWGTLMAGGAGLENYFGYAYASYGGSDGAVTNYAGWDRWWDQCRIAHAFFTQYLPFHQMRHDDDLTSSATDFCFARRGEVYAIYLREGGTTTLDLTGVTGTFEVKWYNPRSDGALQNGSVVTIDGGAKRAIGNAPGDGAKDWAVLVRKTSAPPPPANQAPSAKFKTPAAGNSFTAPATVAVEVTATDPDDGVARVDLYVNGTFNRTEQQVPYQWTLSGLVAGSYTLTAKAFDTKGASATATVSFTVTPPPRVTGFTLVNADTDRDIGPLKDGDTINLLALPTANLNVRANTEPATIGSVKFGLDGNASYHTENGAPYALASNNGNDYAAWTPDGGSHTLTATPYETANAGGKAGTSLTVRFNVVSSAKINFQPAGSTTPSGYLADTGASYGVRGNGLTYGWNAANVDTRERNAIADRRLDTLVHMQLYGAFTWQMAVPNGTYSVTLCAGDPSFIDSVYRVSVKGALAVSGTPSSGTKWFTATKTVTVSDGRLTVGNAAGSVNNKLCFIEVTRLTAN